MNGQGEGGCKIEGKEKGVTEDFFGKNGRG